MIPHEYVLVMTQLHYPKNSISTLGICFRPTIERHPSAVQKAVLLSCDGALCKSTNPVKIQSSRLFFSSSPIPPGSSLVLSYTLIQSVAILTECIFHQHPQYFVSLHPATKYLRSSQHLYPSTHPPTTAILVGLVLHHSKTNIETRHLQYQQPLQRKPH